MVLQNPCSLPVGAPGILFSSQLFSNSLIIHEADISARRVQRVNPPSDTCITAECDVTVMEDSGTQTSSDPHFPIVPSSASVHVQHGVHGSDNVLRSELNNIISKLKSEIRMETQARMLSLEAQVAELKQSVNNLINKCRELSQAQPSSKTSTHSRSVRSSHNESTRSHTNALPFRVVWGTSRSCSSVVIQKDTLCPPP